MQITAFQTHTIVVDDATKWVFLELAAGEGLSGYGEAMLPGREPVLITALEESASALVGMDVVSAAPPPKVLAEENATGLLEATVHSAIDQCLWDLRARIAGLPLHRMLGPTLRTEIPLYANINRGTRDRSPEGFATRAANARAEGFEAVKIAPFDGLDRDNAHLASGRAALANAVERVRAVRRAIGNEAMLMVDCHWRLDLRTALQFLDSTAHARIDWFEDALPYHTLDDWSRLKAGSRVLLVGGENARGTRDLLPFLARGIWDVIMPDIRFFGGVTELAGLGALTAQHQVQIAPHNPRGPIGTLASAHAMVGCQAFLMLEYQHAECPWRGELTSPAEVIADGVLHLPDGPGLGVSLNPRAGESE